MTLRSLLLYLDYGSGACMSRAAHKICVTFLGFIILLASNSVSYIIGRDGIA